MKKSLVFALALMLVVAFASSAMAAQVLTNGSYLSTTATGDYPAAKASTLTGFTRLNGANKFVANGTTNYPYEIYLPNELHPENYRIHSNYAKNTDACASCHATHTAVGASLLQWYSAYETCMACHDGTLGTATYNVLGGKIGTTSTSTFGGMFGTGNGSESSHNVTGSMEIAAAPGGSTVDDEQVAGAHGAKNTRWINEFGCESCHSPHGQGGNARILHPDANYAASWAAEKRAVANKYYVNSTTGTVYADLQFPNATAYIIKGYPYSPAVIDGDLANTAYKIDNSAGYSRIVNATTGALITGSALDAVYVTGVASLQVKMTIGNYLQSNETVQHVYGMNFYCGACHTDYNTAAFATTGAGAEATGVYTQAHRHQMGMNWYSPTAGLKFEKLPTAGNTMECLTCHVAHGTSQDYWAATLGGTKGADGTLWAAAGTDASYAELAGSSALKRMPNMGTCEACHAKGEGSEGYNVNAGINPLPTGATNVLPADLALMPSTYNFDARRAEYATADLGWVGSEKCVGCHTEYVDGWKETTHATSSHVGPTGCGRCHNPGNSIMSIQGELAWPVADTVAKDAYLAANPYALVKVGSTTYNGQDIGITCESCHGSGARHILAPTPKNIYNPGTKSIERQAIECGRCHDMYMNNGADGTGLSATSGLSYASVAGDRTVTKAKTSDLETKVGWSVGFKVYGEDPAKFADATQLGATSSHYGGAWGYANSKHFTGTGTAENPNGVVSCNTCHDMHKSGKLEGALKYEYAQICSSCHDASANLAQTIAMPTNSWNRHQIEERDFAHSFKFGSAATIATLDTTVINYEASGTVAGTAYVALGNKFFSTYDSVYAGRNVWARSQTGSAVIGFKVAAWQDAARTTRAYNNYELEWELVSVPSAIAANVSIEKETGAVSITNPGAGNYANANGTYVVKFTSVANPLVSAQRSFTVQSIDN